MQGALSVLLQGHELELVVAVGHLLGDEGGGYDALKGDTTNVSEINCIVDTAVRYLTYRAIRLSLWELAMELALLLPEVSNIFIIKLSCKCKHYHMLNCLTLSIFYTCCFPQSGKCSDFLLHFKNSSPKVLHL